MPRHRGPVDAVPLGEIVDRRPLPVSGDQLGHVAFGQPPRDPAGVGPALVPVPARPIQALHAICPRCPVGVATQELHKSAPCVAYCNTGLQVWSNVDGLGAAAMSTRRHGAAVARDDLLELHRLPYRWHKKPYPRSQPAGNFDSLR